MAGRVAALSAVFLICMSTSLFASLIGQSEESRLQRSELIVVVDAVDDNFSNCVKLRGDAAIEACNRALASGRFEARQLAALYNSRCFELASKSALDRALADCNAAINADPTFGAAFVNKSRALNLRKEYASAVAAANEAVRLLPTYPMAYGYRGEAYRQMGKRDEAKADYLKVISLNATGYALQIAQSGLAALSGESAAAEPNDDYKKCSDYSGDAAIAACTRAIDSGKIAGPQLATAYGNRCAEWFAKGERDARTPAGQWLTKADYERALADCVQALRIDPTQGLAKIYQVRIFLATKDLLNASVNANAAVITLPQSAFALAVRGQVLMALNQRGDANADFAKALSMNPNAFVSGIAKAGLTQLNDWSTNADENFRKCRELSKEAAIAACDKAIASGKFVEQQLADAYANRCFERFVRADFDGALADCDASIKADSSRGIPHLYRARVLLAKKDPNKALAAVSIGLERLSENALAFAVRGDVYRALNRPDDARADYSKAMALDAKGMALNLAQAGLALLPVASANVDPNADAKSCASVSGELGIAACDRVIASGKITGRALAVAHSNRCIQFFLQAEYDRAQAACNDAIQVDKSLSTAYPYRVDSLLKLRDTNRAFAQSSDAVRLFADDARAYVMRGDAHLALGRRADAKADYTKALSLNPSAVSLKLARGGLLAAESKVNYSYEPPSSPQFRVIYLRLARTQVLERLVQVMAPLRLPREIEIRVAQCNALTKAYEAGKPVTICYELVDQIITVVGQNTEIGSRRRADVVLGAFIQTALREIGHAVFDIFNVPIWGKEDDAVDRLAAFISSQFGADMGSWAIEGAAQFLLWSNNNSNNDDFVNERSPDAQRYFNYLCIAYGKDPAGFQYLADKMPPARRNQCRGEYNEIRKAFDLRIMPFVDPDLAIKVKAMPWIFAEDVR